MRSGRGRLRWYEGGASGWEVRGRGSQPPLWLVHILFFLWGQRVVILLLGPCALHSGVCIFVLCSSLLCCGSLLCPASRFPHRCSFHFLTGSDKLNWQMGGAPAAIGSSVRGWRELPPPSTRARAPAILSAAQSVSTPTAIACTAAAAPVAARRHASSHRRHPLLWDCPFWLSGIPSPFSTIPPVSHPEASLSGSHPRPHLPPARTLPPIPLRP